MFALVAAACNGTNHGVLAATDAGKSDSRPADAPNGSGSGSGDASSMPTGSHTHYVVNRMMVPTTTAEEQLYGLDLTGGGLVNNQFGGILTTLTMLGLNPQLATTTAINEGEISLLADVQTTSFTDASATGFTTYFGTNPMPPACNGVTCGQQLTGTAMFTVAGNSPHDAELLGVAQDGTFLQGRGQLWIELALVSEGAIELGLIGARVQLTGVSASGITSGILAGGLPQSTLDVSVLPALVASFDSTIQAQCCGTPSSPQPTCNYNATPSCGCSSGTGATLLAVFDTSHDCTVSLPEFENNPLIKSVLAPDMTINGAPALSVGVGFSAVGAEYTP
jgi:hypothetical protein